ncbi:hypothetical protein QEN19_002541 [Hanseniaspora menglaensis]
MDSETSMQIPALQISSDFASIGNMSSYINSVSTFSDKEFDLLSTIRYDPSLAARNSKFHDNLNFEAQNLELTSPTDILSTLLIPDSENTMFLSTHDKLNEDELLDVYFYRFMLLGEHLKRIQFSLKYFGWTDFMVDLTCLMELLIKALPVFNPDNKDLGLKDRMIQMLKRHECYKMRVLINKRGEIRCEAHIIASPPLTNKINSKSSNYFLNNLLIGFLDEAPTYTVYIYDTQITPTCFTSFKTTNRAHYNEARKQMQHLHIGKNDPSEILLFNTSGELMEGSITNVFIRTYIGDKWFYTTPALSSGCLCGVMRNFLVSKRVVTENKKINIHQLKDGDEILLSNGIIGLVKGRIVKPDTFRLK